MRAKQPLYPLLTAILLGGMALVADAIPEDYFVVKSICTPHGRISPSHTGTKIDGYGLVSLEDRRKSLELRDVAGGRSGYNSLPAEEETENGGSGYNKARDLEEGRSGYNGVQGDVEVYSGRSGYNRGRDLEDGRSGYNSVPDDVETLGRSGYNKAREVDLDGGRSGYNSVPSDAEAEGRSGYNKARELDSDEGRSGYNSLPDEVESEGRSGYNKPQVVDSDSGRSGYNSVPADVETEGRSGYKARDVDLDGGRSGYNSVPVDINSESGRSGYNKRRGIGRRGDDLNSLVLVFGDGAVGPQYRISCSDAGSLSFQDEQGQQGSILMEPHEIYDSEGNKFEGTYLGWKGVVRWGFVPIKEDGETYWTARLMTPEVMERDGEVFGFLSMS